MVLRKKTDERLERKHIGNPANLQARMKDRSILRQKPKAAVLNQIASITMNRFRNKCFEYLLHFLPSQSVHPAHLSDVIYKTFQFQQHIFTHHWFVGH